MSVDLGPETDDGAPVVAPVGSSVAASGLWRIQGGAAVPVDRGHAGPLTVLVPAEDVLTVAVDLPFATRAQRAAAAPFAVEGMTAEPLERLHVALGMEVAPRRHLCSVVRHETMRRWIALLTTAGLERCILTPDALVLPAPPEGAWSLTVDGPRALVRTWDGAGFAIETAALASAWTAAGRPRLLASGDAPPEAMREGLDELSIRRPGEATPSLVVPPVDLLQGLYAARRRAAPGGLARRLATLLGVGAAAHVAILAVDTLALHRMAEAREAETRAVVARRAPGSETDPDIVGVVERLAPPSIGDGPAVARLAAISQALTGQPLAYRVVRYAPEAVTLSVTAPDAGALDRAVQALAAAGLPADSRLDPQAPAGAATATGVSAVLTVPGRGA